MAGTVYWSALHGWSAVLGGSAALLVLAAIPASMLVSMGYYPARATRGEPEPGYLRGAWITAGYLPMVVVSYGWVVLRLGSLSRSVEVSGGPGWNPLPLLVGLVGTGVVVPAACIALGGAAVAWRFDE